MKEKRTNLEKWKKGKQQCNCVMKLLLLNFML